MVRSVPPFQMNRRYFLVTALLLFGTVLLWFEANRDTSHPEPGNSSSAKVADTESKDTINSPGVGRAITFQPSDRSESQVLRDVPVVEMPPQDQIALLEKGRTIDEKRGDGVFRFAEPIEVAISPEKDGAWETSADGSEVWRLRIASPGASSLNLGLSEYRMPSGGRLSVFPPGAERDRPIRDFTEADNEDHGQLWTPMFGSDELVLEVTLPPGGRDLLVLKVTQVNHGFRKLGDDKANGNNASGSCNIDVACTTDPTVGTLVQMYADQVRSVGAYTLNGIDTCSGALINNTANDAKPYFLTAEHCGISPANAPSMVVYFNFENSICRTPGSSASGLPGDGVLTQFNTGAIHRAEYEPSDFCLVELDDPMLSSYNAFYAGWDRSGDNGMAVGIHHPAIAEKRISFELDDTVDRGATHVEVSDWDYGTTEGGSSGSPLFDASGRIIGDLTGGLAACGNNEYDEYGRVSVSWTGGGTSATRLSDWLDPINSGSAAIDGINQDDALSINNVTITEGNSGTQTLQFTVTLARESNETVTVDYSTADGEAVAPGDYTAKSNTLTFGPSDTSETISITIIGDGDPEENETFEVRLSNPSNAQIADATGIGTINNDDFITPVITSSLTASGAEGVALTYLITAQNTPTEYAIVNEPGGMTINESTGEISWIPSVSGQISVTIQASNSAGTDTEVLIFDIAESQLKQGIDTSRFFTEGSNIWLLETTTTHDGTDSAKSPAIKNDQTAFFETQVTAPAGGDVVTFWWKVSSEDDFDFLRFLADGNLVDEISGEVDWTFVPYPIQAGQTVTLRWEYSKDGSVSEGDDAGYIDQLIVGSDDLLPVFTTSSTVSGIISEPFYFDINAIDVTGFSAVNLPPGLGFNTSTGEITGTPTGPVGSTVATITATNANGSRAQNLTIAIRPSLESALDDDMERAVWSNTGNADWFGQFATNHDGSDSAQSGEIDDNENSVLEAAVNFDGTQNLSFWWKVSSEEDFDELTFRINGATRGAPISGESRWRVVQNMTVPAGASTISWTYDKDGSVSDGTDTAWVDEVRFSYQLRDVTNLTASGGGAGGGVEVNWNFVINALSYRVFRSTSNDPATASLIASPTTTSYTDLTGATGTLHYYWVRAHSQSTQLGAPGSPVTATAIGVSPPSNVSASDLVFPDKIRVSWDAETGAENYRLYRSTTDDFQTASQIVEIASATTNFDDSAANPTPDSFYYWVTATKTIDSTEYESDPGISALGSRAVDVHGGSVGAATSLSLQSTGPTTVTGTLESGDKDVFTFTLGSPARVIVYTTGSLDTVGALSDSTSTILNDPIADDDAGQETNFRSETVLPAGTFSVEVAHGPGGDPTGTYDLHIEPSVAGLYQPDLQMNSIGGNLYGGGQVVSLLSRRARPVAASGSAGNDGIAPDTVSLSGTRGNRLFKVDYSSGGNVTAALHTGSFRTPTLAAGGAAHPITATVMPARKAFKKRTRRGKKKWKRRNFAVSIGARSAGDLGASDSITISVSTR